MKTTTTKIPKIPFKTTKEEQEIIPILKQNMILSGVLSLDFIEKVCALASKDQGVFDLVCLWNRRHQESLEILSDITESIKDYTGYED